MLQNSFTSVNEVEAKRQLGSGFTATLMTLEPGQWHGPVLSGYGVHLVYVSELKLSTPVALAEVKDKVLADWHVQNSEKFKKQFLNKIKSQYEIIIDELPSDRLLKQTAKSPSGAAVNTIGVNP